MNNLNSMPHYGWKQLIAILGDIGAFYLSIFVFSFVRYGLDWQRGLSLHLVPLSLILPFWLLTFFAGELYENQYFRFDLKLVRRSVGNIIVASVISVVLFYLFPDYLITPKTNLIIFAAVFSAAFLVWRRTFFKFLGAGLKTKTIFLGRGRVSDEVYAFLGDHPELGYKLEGKIERLETVLDHRLLRNGLDLIVVEELKEKEAAAHEILSAILLSGASVLSLEDFYEQVTGRVSLDLLDEMWFIDHLGGPETRLNSALIWLTEKIISLVGLIVVGILLPVLALAVKLDSKGPIFYYQKRVGRNKKIFTIYKFRTMRALSSNGSAEVDGKPQRTVKGDRRITRIGKFLRLTKIDELPQFWNILKGEMAIVGPRPERPEEWEELIHQLPFNSLRLLVKPGATGWAQINYKAPTNLEEVRVRLAYDL
ncbi:MAG TPA: sugar transferase, partial [Candidatus Tyrphobacter sp.]|nr:sugar transferase [Candidatus Tyrphobacter sp.]